MNARIHQFGIFSSIGATPKQIRTCLLQEAAVLSIVPMIVGSLLGILISYGVMGAVNIFASGVSKRHEAVHIWIHYSGLVFDGVFFGVDTCGEIKQNDAAGGNPEYRRFIIEEKKTFQDFVFTVWHKGRTCRECPESTEKTLKDLLIILTAVFSGIFHHACVYHAFRYQYQVHLF